MMTHIFIALLLVIPQLSADDDCGNGLPCGPVPWRVPALPALQSPTPFPTVYLTATPTYTPTVDYTSTTATPTPTLTPTPTVTWSPTPTGTIGVTAIPIDDIEIIAEETPDIVVIDGGEITLDDLGTDTNTTTFWNYVIGLFSVNIGKMTAIIQFGFFTFAVYILIKSSTFILPILALMIGILRKLLDFVLKFIPGIG